MFLGVILNTEEVISSKKPIMLAKSGRPLVDPWSLFPVVVTSFSSFEHGFQEYLLHSLHEGSAVRLTRLELPRSSFLLFLKKLLLLLCRNLSLLPCSFLE